MKKKKYQKPRLKRINPMDTAVTGASINSNINQGVPFEFNFTKEIKPEIQYDPSNLPEPVSIDHPRCCPKCGTPARPMVAYGVMGAGSLSKNHCVVCGHNWGPGDE